MSNREKNWWEKSGWMIFIIIGLPIIVSATYIAIFHIAFEDYSTSGSFGDSFGVVTALFTGAGFIGFLYALYFQRLDLQEQRNSIELQQEELKQSNEELRMTREVFRQQSFETTFFSLLKLLEETKSGLVLSSNEDGSPIFFNQGSWSFERRFVFEMAPYEDLVSKMNVGHGKPMIIHPSPHKNFELVLAYFSQINEGLTYDKLLSNLEKQFSRVNKKVSTLDTYFKTLSMLLSYVYQADYVDKNSAKSSFYIALIKAQLDKELLVFMLFTALFGDIDGFKSNLVRSRLLDEIDDQYKACFNLKCLQQGNNLGITL